MSSLSINIMKISDRKITCQSHDQTVLIFDPILIPKCKRTQANGNNIKV